MYILSGLNPNIKYSLSLVMFMFCSTYWLKIYIYFLSETLDVCNDYKAILNSYIYFLRAMILWRAQFFTSHSLTPQPLNMLRADICSRR